MFEFEKREFWCAVGALVVAIALFLISGFNELSWLGLALTIGGLVDFLFFNFTKVGWIASEVYGDPGEELWRFRSFIIMTSGPFVILYSILFA